MVTSEEVNEAREMIHNVEIKLHETYGPDWQSTLQETPEKQLILMLLETLKGLVRFLGEVARRDSRLAERITQVATIAETGSEESMETIAENLKSALDRFLKKSSEDKVST